MAFDGIMTRAMAKELRDNILLGKIDKIYQPGSEELVFNIHTRSGNQRLYSTVNSSAASLRLIRENPLNPPSPLPFCMLLRKHIQGGRITSVEQKDAERIIEITIETLNEMGFTAAKKLIFEIMGKHSNIILLNREDGRIIDSIKHISIDVNRVRQILPGKKYEYPPVQDKVPFDRISAEDTEHSGDTAKAVLSHIGGICPAFARELLTSSSRSERLSALLRSVQDGKISPLVYETEEGHPAEVYLTPLREYEGSCHRLDFPTLSEALHYYYENKRASNRAKQRSHDLVKTLNTKLDKYYLKKKRLNEDLLRAENSGKWKLYGELLTANLHQFQQGMKEVTVTNYYDNSSVTIPLDPRFSPNKNAQRYYKKYQKAKTAVKEKHLQLEENQKNIDYIESVLTYLENTNSIQEIEDLRTELEESGFIRIRKQKKQRQSRKKKYKPAPRKYKTGDGFEVLVGKNNKENDALTLSIAKKTDLWLHTKDIPGSHVILRTGDKKPSREAILDAASIAAFFSKGRESENVPVDYVPVRFVKKPAGAKPGMVIFTNNHTVWVNPKDPDQ